MNEKTKEAKTEARGSVRRLTALTEGQVQALEDALLRRETPAAAAAIVKGVSLARLSGYLTLGRELLDTQTEPGDGIAAVAERLALAHRGWEYMARAIVPRLYQMAMSEKVGDTARAKLMLTIVERMQPHMWSEAGAERRRLEYEAARDAAAADTAGVALKYIWRHNARRAQIIDPNEGNILMLTARRWGKTRAMVEFLRQEVESGRVQSVALIVQAFRDIDDVIYKTMRQHYPPSMMPSLRDVKRRLQFPKPYGDVDVRVFSADNYDGIRGGEYDLIIMDELAHWRDPDNAFDTAIACIPAGRSLRWVAATTPPVDISQVSSIRLLNRLRDIADDTRVGRIQDNYALDPDEVNAYIASLPVGSVRYKAEVEGEFIETPPQAPFKIETIRRAAISVDDMPEMQQIIIGFDVALKPKETADETGIVVVGKGVDGSLYVLDDRSGHHTPDEWAREVIHAYNQWGANLVIAEDNAGGEMLTHTLQTAPGGLDLRIRPVTATSKTGNKQARAMPVAAHYERGLVRHIKGIGRGYGRAAIERRSLDTLEEQMAFFEPNNKGSAIDDRVDALVWACAYFIQGPQPMPDVWHKSGVKRELS